MSTKGRVMVTTRVREERVRENREEVRKMEKENDTKRDVQQW